MSEIEEARSSLVQVRIGGRTYDTKRVPQCNTCTHPARIEIEKRILSGLSYRDIATLYSETEYTSGPEIKTFPHLGWMSIYTHFKQGHMPIEMAVMRHILDERSKDLSEHYDEETNRLVDGVGFAKQVLRQAQQDLVTGGLRPSISDGLAAAKLIGEMESAAGGSVDAEIWAQAMTRYFEVLREIAPQDLWDLFAARLEVDPILTALRRRVESGVEHESIVDAEYTEGEPG